jgi:hypothetical protein
MNLSFVLLVVFLISCVVTPTDAGLFKKVKRAVKKVFGHRETKPTGNVIVTQQPIERLIKYDTLVSEAEERNFKISDSTSVDTALSSFASESSCAAQTLRSGEISQFIKSVLVGERKSIVFSLTPTLGALTLSYVMVDEQSDVLVRVMCTSVAIEAPTQQLQQVFDSRFGIFFSFCIRQIFSVLRNTIF